MDDFQSTSASAPVAEVSAPAIPPASPPTATSVESNSNSSGFLGEVMRSPMDWRSMVVASLLIAVSIMGIVYYRKALQQMEEDKPTLDDIDTLNADVAELKFNLKKALGAKYKLMPA